MTRCSGAASSPERLRTARDAACSNPRTSLRIIALPWEMWRALIAVLRTKGLPSMLEDADDLKKQLDVSSELSG
jgi:hypothetical protein